MWALVYCLIEIFFYVMADNNFLFTHIFYYLPANLGKKAKR